MIVICDGIDKVGKTTLCNRLSNDLHIPIFRTTRPDYKIFAKDNPNRESQIIEFGKLTKIELQIITKMISANLVRDCIFDRFHAVEYAYTTLDLEEVSRYIFEIDDTLSKFNVCYIYLYQDRDIILSKLDKTDVVSINSIDSILTRYLEFYKKSKLEKISTNTTRLTEKQTHDRALSFLYSCKYT